MPPSAGSTRWPGLSGQSRRWLLRCRTHPTSNTGRGSLFWQIIFLFLLTLPALNPVPGPFGMVFGAALALVALQITAGRETVWLPSNITSRQLSSTTIDFALRYAGPVIARVEKLLRRGRLATFTGKPARMVLGVPIFLLAIAIALPIPFGNFLPAFALIIIAVATMERDGLVTLIDVILSMAALVATGVLAHHVAVAVL
ncbi:exopolysaccharide biosynthesis protein [Agrobacterium tumefaciens]|uniref:exopolysaccharide biosynthesis protein n=1 Tax=Agrobacterium tumefaciens TaxID=358 RepID=UPI001571B862|nr:exopolysaccharide biosynthesis protein [Agrobacterium tumefaciens]NTB99207.1 exopolysaccharide biosynthesis protein [Agrobacterium tumefaciens]NTC44506.1 exopolysaccharide biosynthesis protein [Agrobacterium tumefaciens]